MRRNIFHPGILLLACLLVLPACSKKKEPSPPIEPLSDIQKTELPTLAQNTAYLTNRTQPPPSPDFSFEEAPNSEKTASSAPVTAGD